MSLCYDSVTSGKRRPTDDATRSSKRSQVAFGSVLIVGQHCPPVEMCGHSPPTEYCRLSSLFISLFEWSCCAC